MRSLFTFSLPLFSFCLLLLAIFLSLLWYFRRRQTRPSGPDYRYILFRNYATEPVLPTQERAEVKPVPEPILEKEPASPGPSRPLPAILDFDD